MANHNTGHIFATNISESGQKSWLYKDLQITKKKENNPL